VSEINTIVASESSSHSKLAQAILQDFALTNKVLKLVNTASFGQFGGNINTISKAVVILGFDTVRNIAMTLILLEFLQNKSQAEGLKDEVISSFFAGILAAELSEGGRPGDAEEAMICGMFQNLGRLLATFYFFEESQEVNRLMQDQNLSEEWASTKILGLSYNALGVGVAKNWNFPSRLVAGMTKYSEGKIKTPRGDIDQLSVTVNLANELCLVSAITDVSQKASELQKICSRFEGATHLTSSKLTKTLEASLSVLSQRSTILGVATGKSPLLKRIRKWSGHAEPDSSVTTIGEGVSLIDSLIPEESIQSGAPQDPDAMLNAGIQDVTNALVDDLKINDILLMVVETIFRSLAFAHTLIFIRDNKQNAMVAKFGFGEGVDEILPRLKFSLNFVPDVFHLSIDKGVDIVIEDVDSHTIADKIPKWYRDSIEAKCFLMLPIMVKNKAIGVIYADMQEANSLKLTERQLSMLRTLRNQAVLAIKQNLS
jgi:HD-like signal output (HDOD) protein